LADAVEARVAVAVLLGEHRDLLGQKYLRTDKKIMHDGRSFFRVAGAGN